MMTSSEILMSPFAEDDVVAVPRRYGMARFIPGVFSEWLNADPNRLSQFTAAIEDAMIIEAGQRSIVDDGMDSHG